jgi:signal transduction histidine kinase
MIVQISCGIEILKKSQKTINEQMQETFDIISDSVKQMLDIVKYINSSSEEIKIVKEPCRMEKIIDSVIDSIKLLVINKNIKIIKICDSNIILKCDKKRVKEALYNIIKNSCEAIEKDQGEVKIEATKNRRKVICKIYDNGKGIPSNQIQNIIKPFYTTKKIENNNYGLGLTHCYIVMEQHNGAIEIKSEEGMGTCISLLFPT